MAVRDLDPVHGRSLEDVLADHLGVAGLERLAVAGAEARVDLGRVLGDLAAAEDAVGLHDAVERLGLAQELGRLEPDLVLRADLRPLAGLEIDQRVLQVALVDDVEHRAGAGRRERAVDHGRARSAGRPERDGGRDERDERRGEGEPDGGVSVSPARRVGVGDDAAPVAGAGVGRGHQVELFCDVGHVLISSKVLSRLARAACKVADTVPTAIPRASAIPA